MSDSSGSGPVAGPCVAWISGGDVAACCGSDASSDVSVYDEAAVSASMLLYELSGRRWPGVCEQTVRPCATSCGGWDGLIGWPSQWWGWGAGGLDWSSGWGWWGGNGVQICGCQALSQIKLPGYPVTSIIEVKIGGDVLDANDSDGYPNYRLDQYQLLTRMAKPAPAGSSDTVTATPRFWPGCQNLALDDDQPGTFSIRYQYGVAPPLPGELAAAQLGCEIYKACQGQECLLPTNTTKLIRQGVTIERILTTWNLQATRYGNLARSWTTGLSLVDAFLAAYNPHGMTKRPMLVGFDTEQYARRVGAG